MDVGKIGVGDWGSRRMARGTPLVVSLKGGMKSRGTLANANSYSTPKVSGRGIIANREDGLKYLERRQWQE